MKTYVDRMRELREDNDFSQEDIAKVLKTTQQTYSRYEMGINELPIRHLLTLSQFYHVTTDYLLGRDGPAGDGDHDLLSAAAVGRAIVKARKGRKMTQEELCGLAAISRSQLSAMERGGKKPTLEILWRVAAALKTRPSSLMALIEAEQAKESGGTAG